MAKKKLKESDSIFNKISDEQFNRMCEENGWEPLPTKLDGIEKVVKQLPEEDLKELLGTEVLKKLRK